MRLIFQHSILLTRVSSARGMSSVRVSPWLSVGVASVWVLDLCGNYQTNKQKDGILS